MANPLKGELTVSLLDVEYTLKLNMNVICSFSDMRDKDFMHCAFKALNAVNKTRQIKDPLERAEVLSASVDLSDAATLFWLAAKESNSTVEFGEIQEALIDSLDIAEGKMYPIIFADLCSFALTGGEDDPKGSGGNG